MIALLLSLLSTPALAGDWDYTLGGHAKIRTGISWFEPDHYYKPVSLDPAFDTALSLRLKGDLHWRDALSLRIHHETVYSTGDTRKRDRELMARFPFLFQGLSEPINDDRRLMNLTWVLDETDDHVAYHRLDRLSLHYSAGDASVTLGRQALTWGNGLVFNTMDLFNPFAPSDIERDYKVGNDMLLMQTGLSGLGDLQVLAVPHRDPDNRTMDWDDTSVAVKAHAAISETELDLLLAKHYQDHVLGLGAQGYLGEAAWRADAVWTVPADPVFGQASYISLTANMDYSWVWFDKNWYGYVELHYNGLGRAHAAESLREPYVAERLDRGDLFTLGRYYAAAHVNMEPHPLVSLMLTAMVNLDDGSGLLQPRATWSLSQDLELLLGANIPFGERDTEYGGLALPMTDTYSRSPFSLYCRLNWFF